MMDDGWLEDDWSICLYFFTFNVMNYCLSRCVSRIGSSSSVD